MIPKAPSGAFFIGLNGMDLIRKREVAAPPPAADPREFVMSDGSVDRMGDVIEPDGWRLDRWNHCDLADRRAVPVERRPSDLQRLCGRWHCDEWPFRQATPKRSRRSPSTGSVFCERHRPEIPGQPNHWQGKPAIHNTKQCGRYDWSDPLHPWSETVFPGHLTFEGVSDPRSHAVQAPGFVPERLEPPGIYYDDRLDYQQRIRSRRHNRVRRTSD